ncbi:MAG: nitrilase-related carbon-nitrogen hydrolase [Omnitrophica WOR_2 bacterium]
MTLKIALAQMRCEKGAVAANLDAIESQLNEASRRNVDILCLPEMSISGYADPSRYPHALLRLEGPEIGRLLEMTRGKGCTVIAGLIEANGDQKPFITQVVVRGGELAGYYRKITILDEEAEWFSAGTVIPIFRHEQVDFGIAICADIENEAIFAECKRRGAQVVFAPSAPGLYGEQSTRDWLSSYTWWEGDCQRHLSRYAEKYGLWIAVATQAGRTVDEDFPGGGFLFDPSGQLIYATQDWSEGTVYPEIGDRVQAIE